MNFYSTDWFVKCSNAFVKKFVYLRASLEHKCSILVNIATNHTNPSTFTFTLLFLPILRIYNYSIRNFQYYNQVFLISQFKFTKYVGSLISKRKFFSGMVILTIMMFIRIIQLY